MKTYSFHDALTALTEGRCRSIKSEDLDFELSIDADKDFVNSSKGGFIIPSKPMLGQWTLVDETPKQVFWSKPEHVPFPCWLCCGSAFMLVIGVGEEGIHTKNGFTPWLSCSVMEWSPNCKDKKPCTVEEA